jgi:tetratricopeptide (TPR) repeat protein
MREIPERRRKRAPDLMGEIRRALWAGEAREVTVPLFVDLARQAEEGSEPWLFAVRALASIAAEHEPWRASLLARRVLAHVPNDEVAWAAMGLAQSVSGNLRFAARCYERAILHGGNDVACLHNLGHLYDVALGRVGEAVNLLERALAVARRESSPAVVAEVAASYAHALAQSGDAAGALAVLKRAIPHGRTRDQAHLFAWIEARVAEPEPRCEPEPY